MSGKELLLHGEADPGSGLAHISLDLTDILDVSADVITDPLVRNAHISAHSFFILDKRKNLIKICCLYLNFSKRPAVNPRTTIPLTTAACVSTSAIPLM